MVVFTRLFKKAPLTGSDLTFFGLCIVSLTNSIQNIFVMFIVRNFLSLSRAFLCYTLLSVLDDKIKGPIVISKSSNVG